MNQQCPFLFQTAALTRHPTTAVYTLPIYLQPPPPHPHLAPQPAPPSPARKCCKKLIILNMRLDGI